MNPPTKSSRILTICTAHFVADDSFAYNLSIQGDRLLRLFSILFPARQRDRGSYRSCRHRPARSCTNEPHTTQPSHAALYSFRASDRIPTVCTAHFVADDSFARNLVYSRRPLAQVVLDSFPRLDNAIAALVAHVVTDRFVRARTNHTGTDYRSLAPDPL